MLDVFSGHNLFKESIALFESRDPHLKKIRDLPFTYCSKLIRNDAFHIPGIYLVTGGRQVGKTTFLKQFILNLLKDRQCHPNAILFMTGELIESPFHLQRLVNQFYQEGSFQYLVIDEVNYTKDWDKAIKFLADSGIFDTMSVILTGSDSHIIKMAMTRFAGRRGKAETHDFVFHPLSFKEVMSLQKTTPKIGFENYLIHGGYLPAISTYMTNGTIPKYVFQTYIEWVIGDMIKHHKSETYLSEVFQGVLSSYGSQVSWNSLAKYLAIDHHQTVSDYCNLLEMTHVLHIVSALDKNRLRAAPKKAKKIYFRDPFIYHVVQAYVSQDFSFDTIRHHIADPRIASVLAEAVVIDHGKRHRDTYYIKGSKGEVDVAIIEDNAFIPIEVKWTKQIRPQDIKQVSVYPNGMVLTPFSHSLKGFAVDIRSLFDWLMSWG